MTSRLTRLWRNPIKRYLGANKSKYSTSPSTMSMDYLEHMLAMSRRPIPFFSFTSVHKGNKKAPLGWPGEFFDGLFVFYERGRYGYSYRDIWSLDHYLSGWLPAALSEYLDGHGVPTGFETVEEWNDVLIKIAMGFNAHKDLANLRFTSREQEEKLRGQVEEGLALFAEYFGALWD